MSDLQVLFLVLVALYLWECAVWLPRVSVAFVTGFGRAWQMVHPGTLLGNARGGFILAAPLPPLGTLITAHSFPLSLSPEAALAFVSTHVNPGWRARQSGRWLAWEAVREVRADAKKVLVNGKPWLTAPTPGYAGVLVDQLSRLAALAPAQRERTLRDWVAASFDVNAIKQRRQAFLEEERRLRWLGNALFAHLFFVAPVAVWFVGIRWTWPWLLLGLAGLMLTTAALFRGAHRRLYPEGGDARFTLTLTLALSPANAIRVHDALSRSLLESFHPLAVASVLLPKAGLQDFARRVLLDLRHPARPVCPSHAPVVRAAEAFARARLREAAEDLLRRCGMEAEALCRPPDPADASCRAYCPRCRAQFTTAAGECADCGGLARVAFHSPRG